MSPSKIVEDHPTLVALWMAAALSAALTHALVALLSR